MYVCIFKYITSFIVVQVQLSPFFPCPTHPHLQLSILSLFDFVHGFFIHVPWLPFPFFPCYPLPSSPGYCQFVLYFNVSGYILLPCLFCLFRFHLKVRSYGIFLSLPGLFHLAQCSPVPSMLSWRVGVPPSFLLCSIHCTNVSQFFDPVIYWWAPRLLLALGYGELCCYEHWGA